MYGTFNRAFINKKVLSIEDKTAFSFCLFSCMQKMLRFIVVGVLNTAIDLAVLNALVLIFGLGFHGELYLFFKGISFIAAVSNSYFWNKYWVFEKNTTIDAKESSLFLTVSGAGFLLNVLVSSFIFALIQSTHLISLHLAANIGALAGTLAVLSWNFFGYKYVVFKHHE